MAGIPSFTEKDLLLRLHKGDERAFQQVFEQYYPSLCLFAHKFTDEYTDSEDLVAEFFLKFWENRPAFDTEVHLRAHLFHSVRNACFSYLSQRKHAAERQHVYIEDQEVSENSYLTKVSEAEAYAQLYRAIDSLPKQAAAVLILTYIEGKTNQEAAGELRLSIHTIKSQKRRALNLLRSRLPPDVFQLLFIALPFLHP